MPVTLRLQVSLYSKSNEPDAVCQTFGTLSAFAGMRRVKKNGRTPLDAEVRVIIFGLRNAI